MSAVGLTCERVPPTCLHPGETFLLPRAHRATHTVSSRTTYVVTAPSPSRPIQSTYSTLPRFHSMVDPSSGRLYYKLNPKEQRFVVEPSPVRDLGTVADLGVLQACLGGGNEFGQASG